MACPQRRSATIFPCRCAPFLARQNSRRPPLSAVLRPFGCGSIAPGLSIAIKAARGGFERQTGDHVMATIGTFTLDRDGSLKGQIKTLTLSAEVSLEPVESDEEGAPAYRLYAGAVELGAAWAKTAKESGREYHQVRLDDPSFPAPIFANLIEDEDSGSFALIWNRQAARSAAARATAGAKAAKRPTSKRLAPIGRGAHFSRPYRNRFSATASTISGRLK